MQMDRLSDNSFRLKCTPHATIGEISVNVSIDLVGSQKLSISLSSITDGVEEIMQGLIKLIRRQGSPFPFVQLGTNMTITILLNEIPQLNKFVLFNSVAISSDGIYADMSIKSL